MAVNGNGNSKKLLKFMKFLGIYSYRTGMFYIEFGSRAHYGSGSNKMRRLLGAQAPKH
jgi:hypothetical protein